MKGNSIQLCALFLITLSLSSCTVISKKIDSERELDEDSFVLTQTHYRDVIGKIGPPSKLSKYNGGLVFLYESIDIRENQFGFNVDYNIFRWLKFSYARGIAQREALLLIFDGEGYLIAKNFKDFKENLGSGQAINFLISIESLVDASSLEEDPPQLSWGQSLLKPLPVSLNYNQNLGTGTSGIEQLGAPNTVGQHSLELAD